MKTLRPYQREAVAATLAALEAGQSRGLITMPTGTGKTLTAAEITRRAHESTRQRVMLMAHTKEIVEQLARAVEAQTGLPVDIDMAERRASHSRFTKTPIVVGSVQTLSRGRFRQYDPKEFCLLFTDEAHHATAGSYRKVADHFHGNADLLHVGLTATPDRLDRVGLHNVYDEVIYQFTIRQAIEQGWLVPIRQHSAVIHDFDLSDLKTRAGDITDADIAREMELCIHDMGKPIYDLSQGIRRFLAFCPTVATSANAAQMFRRWGMATQHVDGETPKVARGNLFRNFGRGDLQGLCNVGVATEGWDDTAEDGRGLQIIANMRPTKSRAKYAQMIGRGTRPLPGTVDGFADDDHASRHEAIAASHKTHVDVLDFVGICGEHKLICAADILAGDTPLKDAAVKRAREKTQAGIDGADVMDLLAEMEREEEKEQEERRLRDLRVGVQYKLREVDPFDRYGVTDRRVLPHLRVPMTRDQRAVLERNGFTDDQLATMNKGMASKFIDKIFSQPSEKQRKVIQRAYGSAIADSLDRKSANKLITATVANGWKPIPNPQQFLASQEEAA